MYCPFATASDQKLTSMLPALPCRLEEEYHCPRGHVRRRADQDPSNSIRDVLSGERMRWRAGSGGVRVGGGRMWVAIIAGLIHTHPPIPAVPCWPDFDEAPGRGRGRLLCHWHRPGSRHHSCGQAVSGGREAAGLAPSNVPPMYPTNQRISGLWSLPTFE